MGEPPPVSLLSCSRGGLVIGNSSKTGQLLVWFGGSCEQNKQAPSNLILFDPESKIGTKFQSEGSSKLVNSSTFHLEGFSTLVNSSKFHLEGSSKLVNSSTFHLEGFSKLVNSSTFYSVTQLPQVMSERLADREKGEITTKKSHHNCGLYCLAPFKYSYKAMA